MLIFLILLTGFTALTIIFGMVKKRLNRNQPPKSNRIRDKRLKRRF